MEIEAYQMQYSFDKSFPGSTGGKGLQGIDFHSVGNIRNGGTLVYPIIVQYINIEIDAKDVGFDDSFIYDELELKPADRKLPSEPLLRNEAIKAFEMWNIKADKIEY